MAVLIDGSLGVDKIKDGTIVDADVVSIAASKLTGALPAISGASLTNLPGGGKILQVINYNLSGPGMVSTTSTSYILAENLATISVTKGNKVLAICSGASLYQDTNRTAVCKYELTDGTNTAYAERGSGSTSSTSQTQTLPVLLTTASGSGSVTVSLKLYLKIHDGAGTARYYTNGGFFNKIDFTLMEVAV